MSQQLPMNMAAMGGQMGGPVGGAGIGTPTNSGHDESLRKLNTAIYDHLIRSELYTVAREMKNHTEIDTRPSKQSPSQRGQQTNGIEDGMDADSQDPGFLKKPEDLPMPINLGAVDGPFLQDWWCQFWEIYQGHRNKGRGGPTAQYLSVQRGQQNNRMAMMGNITNGNPNMRNFNPMMQANGMNAGGDLKRQAMQNPRNMYVGRVSTIVASK